ncbi:hypothetical protein OAD67_01695 [bacterium]|jgi:hypothetical protein|nr:hypothetical protein [bacterium]|tara:strand:+ start:22917 stop:23066 length:150 start_codon:yes stop_codon:yes gene_type:complete
MTTPEQRNLISAAGFIGLVAAAKDTKETYVKATQVLAPMSHESDPLPDC